MSTTPETHSDPLRVPLSDQLGPLPEPRWVWAGTGPRPYEDAYSEDQMLTYAAREVAAERKRWESALGAVMPADFKDWHQNSAAERPAVAAWVIRNLRDREAYLEGMLDDVEDRA